MKGKKKVDFSNQIFFLLVFGACIWTTPSLLNKWADVHFESLIQAQNNYGGKFLKSDDWFYDVKNADQILSNLSFSADPINTISFVAEKLGADSIVHPRLALLFFRPVSINQADIEVFTTLPRIGPVLGKRIIEKRTNLQGFQRIEDLLSVKGIGPKTLAKLQALITL